MEEKSEQEERNASCEDDNWIVASGLMEPKVEILTDSEAEDDHEQPEAEEESELDLNADGRPQLENTKSDGKQEEDSPADNDNWEQLAKKFKWDTQDNAYGDCGTLMNSEAGTSFTSPARSEWGAAASLQRKSNAGAVSPSSSKFRCIVCNYIARSNSHLLQHERTHTGERPFTCVLCRISFTRKAALERHMMSHVDDADNDPLACDICGSSAFVRRDELFKHLKQEHGAAPFCCRLCSFVSGIKGGVAAHLAQAHPSSGASFACPRCGFVASSKEDLAAHEHQHSTEFSCEVCSTTFSHQGDLRRHQHKHYGRQWQAIDGSQLEGAQPTRTRTRTRRRANVKT